MASVCWSLQCPISALTQAGGGGLLFRSLVPSRCGEGLALLSALRCSGSRLIYMEHALRCARFQPLGVPQKCETKSCTCFLRLPRQSGSGSQGLDWRTLPGCGMPSPLRGPSLSFRPRQSGACALCPPRPQPQSPPAPCVSPRPSQRMSTIQNLRRSLIRNWRPVCSAVGAAVLGDLPAPFPSPLPPASGRAGPVCSLRALLWTCSVPLFCERPAVCSGQLIFSLYFAIPQFKLVTHKSSLRLSSGHSGPVLTLSNAARSSPFHPHLLVADAGVWGTFLLGVAFRHVICGFYLLFPSQSGCPPRFKNFSQTCQCEGFLGFGNFLY